MLLADTFNSYFEPENLRAALRVLAAAGYRVTVAASRRRRAAALLRPHLSRDGHGGRGARRGARTLEALAPHVARGVAVVGLEPSCLFGLRDEFRTLLPGAGSAALAAAALTFEEFLARERAAGRWQLPLRKSRYARALVHGHCHQKAFGAMPSGRGGAEARAGARVETIASSCCGMAGASAINAKHFDVSLRMARALAAARGARGGRGHGGRRGRHELPASDSRRRAAHAVHVARVLAECLPA